MNLEDASLRRTRFKSPERPASLSALGEVIPEPEVKDVPNADEEMPKVRREHTPQSRV